MHRLTRNELRLDFTLTPLSPVSIQARATMPPRFVRAAHPGTGEPSAYIPGSTLKGALRTAAEQVCQSAGLDCCDAEHPCDKREAVIKVRQSRNGAAIYRALCCVCRVFGSKDMRGHLSVADLFPAEPLDPQPSRDADPAEIVQHETFYGSLTLRNFERWQVGLLALLMARVNIAEVQLGGNRAAGMGSVAIRYHRLCLIYPGGPPDSRQQEALQTRLHGVGQLMGANNAYGLTYPDVGEVADLPDSVQNEAGFGYTAVIVSAEKPPAPPEPEPDDAETDAPAEVEDDEFMDESDVADKAHGLIDNVLTQQALAWGSYVRARKPIL